jgi:hypothetical protein
MQATRPQRVIRRRDLQGFLRHVTDRRPDGRPLFPIFSVYVARREDLFLRYPPIDQYTNGPLARVGDFCNITDKGRNIVRNVVKPEREFSLDVDNARTPVFTRRGEKIVLQPKGTWRWMTIKNWAKDQPHAGTKHWQPKGGKLNFNPADHDLFLVMGMYNDTTMRFGQWRPFAMVCLRSCAVIRVDGIDYVVR